MIISINTTTQSTVKVELVDQYKIIDEVVGENKFGSQILLPLMVGLLNKNGLNFGDIREIRVIRGPGSFTGLRVGVSVANALGYALGVPVNGQKMETELSYN